MDLRHRFGSKFVLGRVLLLFQMSAHIVISVLILSSGKLCFLSLGNPTFPITSWYGLSRFWVGLNFSIYTHRQTHNNKMRNEQKRREFEILTNEFY